ncbi:uncharacterized protein LOC119628707 [Bombyx mori]|uniref:Regulatory protein zeste n=1 Tax=Bombyx mori TaxID=7091 RepID=A0A8R2LW48_BOMMO|nr:uncharacterized protein LOC119628707 isoform X1 [Bombyx mori]
MRTSHSQYLTMVEFMEANGDLSKPSGGPRGRNFIQMKWKELTGILNSDSSGDPKSEDKWRKVWSDYKNNCKKKCAKINRAASGTGGGPALHLLLTDLEQRVMQIIGVQAATGMEIKEAGFPQEEISTERRNTEIILKEPEIDWNTPSTSSQPTVAPLPQTEASPPVIDEEEWNPPPQKKRKSNLKKMFLDIDRKTREYASERDRVYEELERDRLRVREFEVRERVRQRDEELRMQGQWLEFMKEAMEAFVRFMERKSS